MEQGKCSFAARPFAAYPILLIHHAHYSLSLDGDVSSIVPLLEKMPWDVVNVSMGNYICLSTSCPQSLTTL